MMIRFILGKKYIHCILPAFFGLLLSVTTALGARVAGEEGVTPSAPPDAEPKTTIQPSIRPPQKRPATIPHSKNTFKRFENNNNSNNISAPEKKSANEKKSEERYVTIDFDNVDIAVFIKFISELTGKNFIIDKGVLGKVTIISPTKISIDEAYEVFLSVLEVYGFATVPAGNVTKIVPAATAKSKNIETLLKKGGISADDKIVTQLIPLKYADPNELKSLFAPFIDKSSLMVPYAPTGTLIITDVLSNIKRIAKIIEEIDVEGIGVEVSVIPLEHATASVLEKSLTAIFQTGRRAPVRGQKGQPVQLSEAAIKITSDERTNSLIVLASENDTFKVKQLIKLLDGEIPRGEGDIHVYYLQNANAEDLVSVLKAIPTEQKDPEKKGRAPVVSKDVEIVADKATNALVITAKKSDYLVLENVIRKLDIPRRMVYIEALLMEVTTDKSLEIGVEWSVGKDIGKFNDTSNVGAFASSRSGSSNIPSVDSDTGALNVNSGLVFGVLGEGIKIGDLTLPSISAVVRAYQDDSDIHILSTPQLMTMDNEEAEIIVAENVPFLTRTDVPTDNTNFNYQNFEYKDVGVSLKITPQINQEKYVRLAIFQEISQVQEQSAQIGVLTTLKRQANTTVVIKDGHTVVIGGLIGETLTKGTAKTPCLGDIPGLGWLFKSFSDTGRKTNLYIFITPHIVEDPDQAKQLYEEKSHDIQNMENGAIKMYQKPWSKDDLNKEEATKEE